MLHKFKVRLEQILEQKASIMLVLPQLATPCTKTGKPNEQAMAISLIKDLD